MTGRHVTTLAPSRRPSACLPPGAPPLLTRGRCAGARPAGRAGGASRRGSGRPGLGSGLGRSDGVGPRVGPPPFLCGHRKSRPPASQSGAGEQRSLLGEGPGSLALLPRDTCKWPSRRHWAAAVQVDADGSCHTTVWRDALALCAKPQRDVHFLPSPRHIGFIFSCIECSLPDNFGKLQPGLVTLCPCLIVT